jgi:hypothetical protein
MSGRPTILYKKISFRARELWKLHPEHGNFQELLETNIYWQILESWKG